MRDAVIFTINIFRTRSRRGQADESFPGDTYLYQEYVDATVSFSIIDAQGRNQRSERFNVNLPLSSWSQVSYAYDRDHYAKQLTEALFASHAARDMYMRYERECEVHRLPGRVIVHLPNANASLNRIEWELLRHPYNPQLPLVRPPDVMLRTHFISDQETALRSIPAGDRLKLVIYTSEPHLRDAFSASWGDARFQFVPGTFQDILQDQIPSSFLGIILQPFLQLAENGNVVTLALWDTTAQRRYTFEQLSSQWRRKDMPAIVFLLHESNTPPAATMLAAMQLHQAGTPLVVVLPQIVMSLDNAVSVAQRALEQLLIEGSLFPLRWWDGQDVREQPAIWSRRRDSRLFTRSLGDLAQEINAAFERSLRESDQIERLLIQTLSAYVQSEQPDQADQLLQQARQLQRNLIASERADRPALAQALRPPELLYAFNLVRPERVAQALTEREKRRERAGPRQRPREVVIKAPELVPVNTRQIITITIAGLKVEPAQQPRNWLGNLLARIDPRALELRTVSFDITLTAYGAHVEGEQTRRISITPDLPASPLAYSIIVEQPGNINLFVEVSHAGESLRPAATQEGVIAGSHIQLRAVQGEFSDLEAVAPIQQQTPFIVAGTAEEPLTVTAPQLPALLMTLRLEPQEREGDYRVSMTVHVPDEHTTYEFLEAEPVHLNNELLIAHRSNPSAYGHELKAALLATEELRRSWDKAFGFYRGMGRIVRLRLHLVGNTDQLHTTHWETLIDPGGDRPLALNQRILLSRYLSSREAQRFATQRRSDQPVQLAVAVASPHDIQKYELQPIDVKAEVDTVSHALTANIATLVGDYPLNRIPGRHLFQRHLARSTLNAITEAANGAQILYLVCHGRCIDNAGKEASGKTSSNTYLMLEKSDGTTDRVEASDFAAALISLPHPPLLIVLASCYSAGDGYQDALRSLGPLLCKAGIPAVIAFQGLVAINTVRILVPALLRRLLNHAPNEAAIDAAVAATRTDLLGEQWWQPILWLRRDDGRAW